VVVKEKMPDGRMYRPSFLCTCTGHSKRTLQATFPPPLQLTLPGVPLRGRQTLCISFSGVARANHGYQRLAKAVAKTPMIQRASIYAPAWPGRLSHLAAYIPIGLMIRYLVRSF
jgi:hypothetical protein